MSLLDKLHRARATREALQTGGRSPVGLTFDAILSPTEGMVDGQRVILAGSNNYLGLTFHPDCLQAAERALREQGTGTTGSRMANGSFAGHVALEEAIGAFFGWPRGIVFSTGYLANLGSIGALAGPGEVLLMDADSHASIFDAAKLSGAEVLLFRHNDAADLERRLRRLGERAASTLVVIEGIYSMLGDLPPLRDMIEIKKRYGTYLLIDEAHSVGVLGERGRGLAEAEGVQDDVDFIVGTFSKSLGATGGFCVSPHEELDLLRYASRPYIFTASPSPSVIASTRAALRLLEDGGGLRRKLWHNVETLYQGLGDAGYRLAAPPSPVIAALVDERQAAIDAWRGLLERGVYVNLMVPPATPGGLNLLRCSLSAAHTDEQIEHIRSAFEQVRPALSGPPSD